MDGKRQNSRPGDYRKAELWGRTTGRVGGSLNRVVAAG